MTRQTKVVTFISVGLALLTVGVECQMWGVGVTGAIITFLGVLVYGTEWNAGDYR